MSREVLIGEFEKNAAETVRVHLLRRAAGPYVDIRIWATSRPGDAPGLHPTSRGLMIAAEFVPDLQRLLEQAYQTAEVER
jgi:hypothetical protein